MNEDDDFPYPVLADGDWDVIATRAHRDRERRSAASEQRARLRGNAAEREVMLRGRRLDVNGLYRRLLADARVRAEQLVRVPGAGGLAAEAPGGAAAGGGGTRDGHRGAVQWIMTCARAFTETDGSPHLLSSGGRSLRTARNGPG